MIKMKVKNPLYIERYGVTFVDPKDFLRFKMYVGSADSSEFVHVDYDKMELVDTRDHLTAKLKIVSKDNYKPYYFVADGSLEGQEDKIKKAMRRSDSYGESIRRDYLVTETLIQVLRDPFRRELDRPMRHKKRGLFDTGHMSYMDGATGYWWGEHFGDHF